MGSAAKPERATLDDLARATADGLSVELVDGALVRKASPSPGHGIIQAKSAELLGPFNRGGGGGGPGGWWIMTEVEVLYAQTEEVFRHDVLGFRRDRRDARPAGSPVKDRPDWVCEILSPTTARFDVVKKQATLHRHGVPHYWLVDPSNDTLTVMRWTAEHYLRVMDAGRGDVVKAEPFDAVELAVSELLGYDE